MQSFSVRFCENNLTGFASADKINLAFIYPKSSGKIPEGTAFLTWNDFGFSSRFEVNDVSLLAECERDMMPVWNDSCVEFFIKPANSIGHMCFEFNCIGILYAAYIRDEKIVNGSFADSILLSEDECKLVKRKSRLKGKIFPEKFGNQNWWIEFFIPFSLLEKYFGKFPQKVGDVFYGNFYKCGEKLSEPHWLAWNEISTLNFHVENNFGKLVLSDKK
ncbi:MAG: carbohydrate-binding family 9-like protein [Ignavibacteriales bacterium]